MKKFNILTIGFAVFTMFFGAGNVVFPLALGRDVGSQISWAMVGFTITAVLVPLLGLISSTVYEGDYKNFFSKAGKTTGTLLTAACMFINALCIPRCITVSYSAISNYIPNSSLLAYSIIVAVLIFITTFKENKVVDILGRFLGPIKILLIFIIVFIGLWMSKSFSPSSYTAGNSLLAGIQQGYYTCDLLGGIFFAHLTYAALKSKALSGVSTKQLVYDGIKISLIGGLLLAFVYISFGVIAASYGREVMEASPDKLLSAIVVKILGQKAGFLGNITIAVACITTAIALTAIVADYLSFSLTKGKLSYLYSLILTSFLIIGLANLGFTGIMKWMGPIVSLIYPTLIALSLSNIFHKLFNFKHTKIVTNLTFILTVIFIYGKLLLPV